MLGSPRSGARTRSGAACRAPPVAGKARCRKHGGAAGSGGQPGNQNARKDGYYSDAEKAVRNGARGDQTARTIALVTVWTAPVWARSVLAP